MESKGPVIHRFQQSQQFSPQAAISIHASAMPPAGKRVSDRTGKPGAALRGGTIATARTCTEECDGVITGTPTHRAETLIGCVSIHRSILNGTDRNTSAATRRPFRVAGFQRGIVSRSRRASAARLGAPGTPFTIRTAVTRPRLSTMNAASTLPCLRVDRSGSG